MQSYLDRGFHDVKSHLPRLVKILTNSANLPCPDRKALERDLDRILGYSRGAKFLSPFALQNTTRLYALFNFITAEAQKHTPGIRLRLEEYAGSLLQTSGGASVAHN